MPKQPDPRFVQHLKSHLVHLHKNLYMNRSDPRYYEKVIRFLDPSSPEAHFRVAQKLEAEGHRLEAIHHYRESMKRYPSDYYYRAVSAIRTLEAQQAEAIHAGQANGAERRLLFKALAALLAFLILFNAALLFLMFHSGTLSRTISGMQLWGGVGKELVYENIELPYAMYFSAGTDPKEVEKKLYERTLQLGSSNPNRAIVVYGLAAEGGAADGLAYPLSDPQRAKQAFVEARYWAAQDKNVSIRFSTSQPDTPRQSQALTLAGANYVRTALFAYKQAHGALPTRIAELSADYPDNYVSFIPLEPTSGSSRVAARYDGGGGWVYDRGAAAAEMVFYPNVSNSVDGRGSLLPYEPLRILVGQEEHKLLFVTGTTVLLRQTVGLGANGQTPNGQFTVSERVRDPLGSAPNVYGSAGLGLGDIAIHGTLQEQSVGGNLSKGCIRLRDADMLRLYPFVPRGAVVDIEAKLPDPARSPFAAGMAGIDLDQLRGSDVVKPDEHAHGKQFYWWN